MAFTTFRLKDGILLGAMMERKKGLDEDEECWPRGVRVAEEAAAGVLERDIAEPAIAAELVLGARWDSRFLPSTMKCVNWVTPAPTKSKLPSC